MSDCRLTIFVLSESTWQAIPSSNSEKSIPGWKLHSKLKDVRDHFYKHIPKHLTPNLISAELLKIS